jgi:cell division septation protein DedD
VTTLTATILAVLGLAVAINPGNAQSTDSTAKRTPTADQRDSLFLRARRLVLEGNGSAGRALVDSALIATNGTPDYPNALYWRAALSATAADAERDYRRIIVEYPFSPHSGDALLALAQLEMARGDRTPAIDHLQRFLLQRPNDPGRVRAGIWLGRLLLDANQVVKGCAVLLRTRAALGDTAVEVRNQVDYYATRCAGVDTVPPMTRAPSAPPKPAHTDSSARRKPAARDSVRSDTARRASARRDSAPARRYTVQVAAYDTRAAADQLVARLSARGIVGRIVAGTAAAPYRVRVGRYATDAEATAAARDLKEKGIVGFVTTTENETASAPVRQ